MPLVRERWHAGGTQESPPLIVFAVVHTRSSPDHPLGDAVETFIRHEDAACFVEEVRGDGSGARELPAYRGAGTRGVAGGTSPLGVTRRARATPEKDTLKAVAAGPTAGYASM